MSGSESDLIDFWLQVNLKLLSDRCHDILSQLPHLGTRRPPVIDQDQGLFVVDPMRTAGYTLPPCLLNEPSSGQFHLTRGLRVLRHAGMGRQQGISHLP